MRIDSKHPYVTLLVKGWRSTQSSNPAWKERKSDNLKRELMLDIVEPQLKGFQGELILLYHTFLTMTPSGVHSFAHGSEMVSDTVYSVTVGRIDGTKLRRTRAQTRTVPAEPYPLRFCIAAKFLVPLRSARVSLVPRYVSGTHQPSFMVRERGPHEDAYGPLFTLDISTLGEHLFALRRGKYDWATKIELVLGTKSVHAWLKEHGSEEAYQALGKRL